METFAWISLVLIVVFVLLMGVLLASKYRTAIMQRVSSLNTSGSTVLSKGGITLLAIIIIHIIGFLWGGDTFVAFLGNRWWWILMATILIAGVVVQYNKAAAVGIVVVACTFLVINISSQLMKNDQEDTAVVTPFPPAMKLDEMIIDAFATEGNSVAAKMVAICRKESGLRHYNDDGTILRGKDNQEDMGLCQINATFNGGLARNLGINPYDHTPKDNIRWAYALYKRDSFDPWERSVAKLEADRKNGGFRTYASFELAAPGNGVWGDVVDIHDEVSTYVQKELSRIGVDDKAYAKRLIDTFEFSHLEKPYKKEDGLSARVNGNKPVIINDNGFIPPWHTFQLKTDKPDPYVNMVWVFFPAAQR